MNSFFDIKSLFYLLPTLLMLSNAAFAASNNDQIARGERGGFNGREEYHPQQQQHYQPQQQHYQPQQQHYQQNQGHNRYQQYQQGGAAKYNNPVMHEQERQDAERRGYTQGVEQGELNSGGDAGVYYNPYPNPYPAQNQTQNPYQNPYQNPSQNQNDPFFYQ